MRVLVTGGSGFIGSHVVDKLRARGHTPVIYDLRPSPWHQDPEHPVDTVLGSITDREALERALHSCDAVAHLAAVADVNDVHASPEDAERVNARGTVTVLEAARRAGVKRIVYASTIWVYSDCEPEAVDEDTLLPPPSHLYTSTKLAGELYCKAYQELYGIDYTILRFGIPYGPRAREAAVIPAFVNKALAGDPLTLAGDGMQSRKFVYVEDLADGVARGLDEIAINRVYNLASDETVTIKQIAETIKEKMGDVEIVHTPARPGDFGGKIVSSARAMQELGWRAATPFSEGVSSYIDWRLAQVDAAKEEREAAIIPAGEPDAEAKPRQVLIISADIGEGHDLPARAVAREFRDEDPDAQVSIVNGLPAMGPILTKLLRENSAFMFTFVPWLFDLQYRLFMYFGPTRWFSRKMLTLLGRRGLMRLIKAHDPDVVVSTYPGVTAVLGELRRKRRLQVPCYSSITDLAGLQFWAHPGIDLHFITHPESTEEVERIAGPGSVRWAKPPTAPAFLAARSRADARRALGLPANDRVIAISGGGWGVGDLVGATRAALEFQDATVLCLCGRNDSLRVRVVGEFGAEPRLRDMGFTDRMGDVLAAADVLVHSSAGLTVLEAIIRGCPVVSYGFGYGHVRASNAALERFKLAQVAHREADLVPAISRALEHRRDPDPSFARRPSTASLILGDERRTIPLPAWRVRTVRAATSLTAMVAIAGFALTTGVSYSVVSHITHMRPVTVVSTDRPEVGVLINAPASEVPAVARTLSTYGLHASFAVGQPSSPVVTSVSSNHDQAVPRLPTGGLVRWLGARGELHKLTQLMGYQRHFLYASNGPSIGQWLVAHGAGGRLVQGAVRLQDADDALGSLRPGEVVEFNVTSTRALAPLLGKLLEGLREEHLAAVPVGRLMQDAGKSDRALPDLAIGFDDVERAAARLAGVAHRTPVLTSTTLDERVGARVFVKSETFQRMGAFKFRGAYNAVSSLEGDELARGVCAVSSGNHAQAVTLAARLCGTRAVILMPSDAPAVKRAATEGYGADVVEYERYGEDREELVHELAAERGLVLVHPYDNPRVMAGQGTLALELLDDVETLDVLLVPVGGGGLISGCATVCAARSPGTRVVGVEPEAGDDVARSLAAGERVRIHVGRTIADGQQAPTPGELTWPVIRTLVSDVVTVSDDEIIEAMRFLFERMKLVVEPSGACAFAALLAGRLSLQAERVGVVLSGANIGADAFGRLLARSL